LPTDLPTEPDAAPSLLFLRNFDNPAGAGSKPPLLGSKILPTAELWDARLWNPALEAQLPLGRPDNEWSGRPIKT